MSNITTIKEIQGLEGGFPVQKIRVLVKAAYPPKTGSNEYGDWSIQSATLEDWTGSLRASFFNSPQNLINLKGNVITITSGKDGKGKFSGMTTLDYEDRKTHAITRQLEVKGAYTIDEDVPSGGEPSQANVRTGNLVPFTGAGPKQNGGGFVHTDEKAVSIEKQVALKAAIKLAVATVIQPTEVIEWANKFYEGVFVQKPEPKPVTTTEAPAGEEKVI